jgi:two-component system, chemotaxis family, protein-glutamate methylesterase/glutaminase
MPRNNEIRVLIVDDSAIVRKILTETLSGEPGLQVVGTAPDPYVARDKILDLQPDVITLDIEMPRMDGLTFLRKLMRYHPLPVVVVSSLAQHSCRAAMEALELGAVEVLAKPGGPYSVGELRETLGAKIRAAAASRLRRPSPSPAAPGFPKERAQVFPASFAPDRIIAIGASTGGTEAIASLLRVFPQDSPGVVVVQHIPPGFSRAFANRMNDVCAIAVKEAEDGDVLNPGVALIAPGDLHMVLRKCAGKYTVSVKTGPRVCYQRPSVDVLFSSVAEVAGHLTAAALLTGMGSDGAQGLLKLRQTGAYTIAQDEATCVVFGMPREAIERDAAAKVLPLNRIAQSLLTASCTPYRQAEPVLVP